MEINRCQGCMSEFRGYPCPSCGYDPAKAQKGAFVLPPETILAGKYLMGRVLGQGGFGITYIGWDLSLERKVAIKEYYPSGQVSRVPGTRRLIWSESQQARSARQDGMQMFLKEARKMAKLEDIPGIVKIRELFQENETAYIVMDFVEGRTLKSILQKNGPMPWNQAKPIFLSAIQAMEKVHQAGLVHRDISPDNLMITPDGKVRILDLGAAKDLNINSRASSMQVAKGGFSPLEQYTQRGGSGTWTDVYAMAATIYYTLTGKLPPNAVDRLEEDTIRWDYPGLQSLPAPALKALKKAMVVQAKQRSQTMAELKQGLFSLAAKSEPSKPAPKPKPMPEPKPEQKTKKGTPKWLIPIVAAVVLIVGGIGVLANLNNSQNNDKTISNITPSEPEQSAILIETAQSEPAQEPTTPQATTCEPLDEAYQEAQALMDSKKFLQAMWAFSGLGYEDSAEMAKEAYFHSQLKTLDGGHNFTVALKADGTVVAAGDNEFGQCNVSDWTDIVAVTGCIPAIGLRRDGTVVATGESTEGQCDVGIWTDIVAVSTGVYHTVGLRSNGTVVTAGADFNGQCATDGWTDIVAIAAGSSYTIGLRSDGTVVSAGLNSLGQCDVGGWTDIVAIAAGGIHTVGLRSNGTVVATGWNEYGQCNVNGWSDIVAVAIGGSHTVGLRSDGTVLSTGWNEYGQCDVSGWTDIVAVVAGSNHTIGLRSNGTVVATGYNEYGQCDVSGWKDIRVPK